MEIMLKKLRQETNLNQKDYGKLFNLTQGTYSNYENGITQPDLKLLVEIADYHKVSLDYLVGRPFANDYGYMTTEEKELLNNFRNMNNQAKIMLLGEAKAFSLMK